MHRDGFSEKVCVFFQVGHLLYLKYLNFLMARDRKDPRDRKVRKGGGQRKGKNCVLRLIHSSVLYCLASGLFIKISAISKF